jgi:hypothetical protein
MTVSIRKKLKNMTVRKIQNFKNMTIRIIRLRQIFKDITNRRIRTFKNINVKEKINKSLKKKYLKIIIKVNSSNGEAAGVLKKLIIKIKIYIY